MAAATAAAAAAATAAASAAAAVDCGAADAGCDRVSVNFEQSADGARKSCEYNRQ